MHPRDLSINDFTYDLPAEKIATHPAAERDLSKLLIFKKGELTEDIYKNIAQHLPENLLLVFNNTKVIPARVLFKKDTGAIIEIFCLEPYEQEYASVMSKKSSATWKCLIGGAGKWKQGNLQKKIIINNEEVVLTVRVKENLTDSYVAQFNWIPNHYSFAEIIEYAGAMPLPPYIKREVEIGDKERYQTIYAEHRGSVAAPTAGLHFTADVFSSLKEKNIKPDYVTLHVGAGTFKPVKAATMDKHEMHAEWIDVSLETIQNINFHLDKNITAVGTTSLRTIESLYWMGLKICLKEDINLYELEIKQWEVYDDLSMKSITAKEALGSLLSWMKQNELQRLFIKTQILIAPGYHFKIANALITNFHQPRSTLLLLVAAITKDWKKMYDHALKNDFRFLSYGDGCLLSPLSPEGGT